MGSCQASNSNHLFSRRLPLQHGTRGGVACRQPPGLRSSRHSTCLRLALLVETNPCFLVQKFLGFWALQKRPFLLAKVQSNTFLAVCNQTDLKSSGASFLKVPCRAASVAHLAETAGMSRAYLVCKQCGPSHTGLARLNCFVARGFGQGGWVMLRMLVAPAWRKFSFALVFLSFQS